MWRRWSLRRRIFLFFALIACGGAAGVGAGLWVGYSRLNDPTALSAFIAAGAIACFILAGLVVWVWLLFDENVAKPLERLASDLRARAHAEISDPVGVEAARYLGDAAPAAAAVSDRLAASRAALADAVARETALITRQNAFLAEALRDISAGVIICAEDHRIALYNTPTTRLFPNSDLLGLDRSIFDLLLPAPIQHALERLQAASEADPVVDLLCPTKDGEVVLKGQMRLAPQPEAEDAAGYVLTLRDVTHELESAAALHQSLREALEQARRPAANLQTVVSVMLGEGGLSEAESAMLQSALAAETESLIGAISALSQTYETLAPEWWPLTEVAVSDVTDALEAQAGVSIEGDDPPLRIRCDGLAMIQLLSAAAAFLRAQGAKRITLRTLEEPPGARIELIAEGVGLDVAEVEAWLDQPLSAEPFRYTAKDILLRHGSELWPEHPPGARPRLCLPIRSAGRIVARDDAASREEFYDFSLLERKSADPSDQRPLSALQFVIFDTETTGLLPDEGDELVQIAAVRVVNQRLLLGESFDTLVNPGRRIPAASTKIHGIDESMTATAPSVAEATARFHRFCGEAVLVAHNAPFDLTFLQRAGRRQGLSFDHPILDTVLLSAIAYGAGADHTLDALCERLGIVIPPEARHTALGDSIATAQALLRLIPMLREKNIATLGETVAAFRTYKSLIRALKFPTGDQLS